MKNFESSESQIVAMDRGHGDNTRAHDSVRPLYETKSVSSDTHQLDHSSRHPPNPFLATIHINLTP
jgi:hypothetical protein